MSLAFRTLGRGYPLGQLFGIPIVVNWTWLPTAMILSFNLSNVFATGSLGLLFGIFATLGLFASILLHELGHALAARRDGIETANITLHFLGGAANIRRNPVNARSEFFVAAAGPAVSFALAAGFWLLGNLSAYFMSPMTDYWGFLAVANLVLAVFNLLPGLPLDGGRILRALIWSRSSSRALATQRAARVGEGLGAVLIAWGILGTLGLLPAATLMTAVIGWFLWTMANRERREAERQLEGRPALNLGVWGRVVLDMYRRSKSKNSSKGSPFNRGPDASEPSDDEVVRFADGREVIVPRRPKPPQP